MPLCQMRGSGLNMGALLDRVLPRIADDLRQSAAVAVAAEIACARSEASADLETALELLFEEEARLRELAGMIGVLRMVCSV